MSNNDQIFNALNSPNAKSTMTEVSGGWSAKPLKFITVLSMRDEKIFLLSLAKCDSINCSEINGVTNCVYSCNAKIVFYII